MEVLGVHILNALCYAKMVVEDLLRVTTLAQKSTRILLSSKRSATLFLIPLIEGLSSSSSISEKTKR